MKMLIVVVAGSNTHHIEGQVLVENRRESRPLIVLDSAETVYIPRVLPQADGSFNIYPVPSGDYTVIAVDDHDEYDVVSTRTKSEPMTNIETRYEGEFIWA